MGVSQLIHGNSVRNIKLYNLLLFSMVIIDFWKKKGWLKEIIHHFFVIFAPKFNNMPDICRISISDDSFVHFSVKIIGAPKKIKNSFEKKTKSFEILNLKIEKNPRSRSLRDQEAADQDGDNSN